MCKFFTNFALEMRKIIYFLLLAVLWVSCSRPNSVDAYRAARHVRDSVALTEQLRSLVYFQTQLDSLLPVADSLLTLFKYEKNPKYQDHGYYVTNGTNGLRILVRDDGKDILMYRNGKRLPATTERLQGKDLEMAERAQHLQIVIRDIAELEKRINKTSLEVQKYRRRLI